jgi:hypothetical protein
MAHEESSGEDQAPGRTVYVAELQCFLCGSLAGSIESDRKPPPPASVWHPADGGAQRIADWRLLRCNRCGGALLAESIETVIRHNLPEETQREAPRRGRPPKWLIEERRRQSEAAETHS